MIYLCINNKAITSKISKEVTIKWSKNREILAYAKRLEAQKSQTDILASIQENTEIDMIRSIRHNSSEQS